MSAVTVKPLVWIERVSGFWQAIDPTGGVYEVMKISENRAVCHHLIAGHGRNIGNGHQSPQDGMTVVQSDYAARILPACLGYCSTVLAALLLLTAAPAPVRS